jgi:segregation and condensation protein A
MSAQALAHEHAGEQHDPGIELLVTLARNGEIDPWDVDIVLVTDRYLAALDRMEDRTLGACGKGLFYACMLLHMKARVLAATVLPESLVGPGPDGGPAGDDACDAEAGAAADGAADGGTDDLGWAQIVSSGDGVLLVPRGRPRQRPITLDDLIGALRRCDDHERRRRDAGLPPSSYFVATTHHDDVAGDIDRVRRMLARARAGRGHGPIPFMHLVAEGLSASGAFVALLFMAAKSEVDLAQRTFYRDLSVVAKKVGR